MWFVEYEKADGSKIKHRWEYLTKEQAMEIYRQNSGWTGNTVYVRAAPMGTE